ncbi:MAG: bifunctional phosphopantothenoylcysteine decarboxylase/phosphopantothenate--cysteine ligase CoaBC [Methanobacteriota archaeon]|nr:MAG: bifunctional phosphopantothenoylcysteine decarboxylase/phosphopantothenate--cysteine ligase CoaBC [Euryarchaeota archaeon]
MMNLFDTAFTHPTTKILSSISSRLEGKRIVLGITGSIASFLAPQLARELIRRGATVIPVMTEAALTMIGKDLMWWATGVEPITRITGNLEHIAFAGVMNRPVDLMLIFPATTNTVAKLAAGIADTPVTLIASSLQGAGVKIQVMAVAHEDLINADAIKEAIEKLKSRGVHFIEPIREEGKAKVPPIEEVVFDVMSLLTPKSLKGYHAIITGGPTIERIDNVRYITNPASGKTAIALALEAKLHGAKVSLILGPTREPIPRILDPIKIESAKQMKEEVLKRVKDEKKAIVILSAAVADFTPDTTRQGKTKSDQEMDLHLVPTEKISDLIKPTNSDALLVVYKAEWGISRSELIARAREKMKKTGADLVIANDLSKEGAGFGTDTNVVLMIRPDGRVREIRDLKTAIAYEIMRYLIRKHIQDD